MMSSSNGIIDKDHTHPENQGSAAPTCTCHGARTSTHRCVIHDKKDFSKNPKSPAGGSKPKKPHHGTRRELASNPFQEAPSLDSLPSIVEHRGGKRKGNRNAKGGKNGKKKGLLQNAEKLDQAKKIGTEDAERALRESIWDLIADALYSVDSPHISSDQQALYLQCLFPSGGELEEAPMPPLPGPEEPVLAPEPLLPEVCTSTMRRQGLCVDPWNITMNFPVLQAYYVQVVNVILNLLLHGRYRRSLNAQLFVIAWILIFTVSGIVKMLAILMTILSSLGIGKTWDYSVASVMKVFMPTVIVRNPLPGRFKYVWSFGFENVFNTLFLIFVIVVTIMPLIMKLKNVVSGEFTSLMRVKVVRLPDDQLCISAGCNERHDVRGLAAGRVDRLACGCFSKVLVTLSYTTFGIRSKVLRVRYVSDELFASLCSMENFRPGLSAVENVKRLRNSAGLAAYVNLDRGDKSVSLAATYWLAELKLRSDMHDYAAFQAEVGAQLE